jgi:hypothetical protein
MKRAFRIATFALALVSLYAPPAVAQLAALDFQPAKGLQDRTGTWWADAKSGLLVEFEIPLGDEPGYDSVRIRLDRVERMNDANWDAFKRRVIGE